MTTKKQISKISDKLDKVNEYFTVQMYDNGYMFASSGRDHNNDYKTAKIMVSTVPQLISLIEEAADMERDD
jgi:hypothetical protein